MLNLFFYYFDDILIKNVNQIRFSLYIIINHTHIHTLTYWFTRTPKKIFIKKWFPFNIFEIQKSSTSPKKESKIKIGLAKQNSKEIRTKTTIKKN